jgi:4-amino-4-deoxy-L-arabinose transferase-like glycosyltransferase
MMNSDCRRPPSRWRAWQPALFLLLGLAALVRLWGLESIPPGWTHDEAGHVHDARAILAGARPLYQTVGYGREPLYDYLGAIALALGGGWTPALRALSALASLATLALTYAWARRAFDRPTALLATALQAASFWSLATARQALRSSLLPALFTAAVYAYWRLIQARQGQPSRAGYGWAALGTLAVGASLLTYLPARALWLLFPILLCPLALTQPALLRRLWRPTLAIVAVGWLLALPMFAYVWAHPEVEQRLAMLDAPLRALRSGDLAAVLSRAADHLAGLVLPGRGDGFLAYNIPGRPALDWATAALALAGLGLCLARWREPAYALLLVWWVLGNLPSLLTGATASTTRAIAALPALFLFPALSARTGLRWAECRWGRAAALAGGALCAIWVAAVGSGAARDYFVRWGESPDVRAAYGQTLVASAQYLDRQPEGGLVVFSSPLPLAPHDPYVLQASLRRRDLATRWCDGRRALLLPGVASARLVVPANAPLDPAFAALPGLVLRERVLLRPDDLVPFVDVYEWDVAGSRAALLARMGGQGASLALPADFGGALRLLGYELPAVRVAPGAAIELATLWQVTADPATPDPEWVLFVHLLDDHGRIGGQEDRLDAPSWDWQRGDMFVQIHRFVVNADAPPGPARLEIGVYRRADGLRLPVLVDGQAVDDRAILQNVEVVTE